MGSIDANACKAGTKLLFNGDLYSVVERTHHKPGKGGAFVKFKLKGIISGKVIEHTVRAGARMETADVTTRAMQYLYKEGDGYVFMDLESYDQYSIDNDVLGFASNFLAENAEAQVTMYEGAAIGVQLPQKMEFEIIETIDDAAVGNTATSVTKDALIDTGFKIQVPGFVKTGNRVRVLTEDGTYVERA
jgi:elongation factor P